MDCQYCKKELKLKRFIKENYDGELVNERFVFICEECKIIISPRLVLLTNGENATELKLLRELYFTQINQNKDQQNVKSA